MTKLLTQNSSIDDNAHIPDFSKQGEITMSIEVAKVIQPSLFEDDIQSHICKQDETKQKKYQKTEKTPVYKTGKIYSVEVTQVSENQQHARQYYLVDPLITLAESFKVTGQLQPVVCTVSDDGKLHLAIGHRRLVAAKMAGLKMIDVLIVDGNPNEISLIENTLREGLTVVQEAEAFHALILNNGKNQEDLSKMFGKASSTISGIIAVAKLPEEIRNDCRCNPEFPQDILILISKAESDDKKIESYEDYKKGLLTRDELKKKLRRSNSNSKKADSFIKIFSHKLTRLDVDKLSLTDRLRIKNGLENISAKVKNTLAIISG